MAKRKAITHKPPFPTGSRHLDKRFFMASFLDSEFYFPLIWAGGLEKKWVREPAFGLSIFFS
jgi:hypothetical protein